MKKDSDEAVSMVVALMLVLAIFATCVAVYSASYVPGLKQQSEIAHTEEVKYSFIRFASDVDNLYSLGREAQFTEPVQLGGGDILLSPVKSSGTIALSEVQIGTLFVGTNEFPINTSIVTYTPSYSSWELQGYRYENGVVWITKGEKETPANLKVYSVENGTIRQNETLDKWLSGMKTSRLGYYLIISMEPSDDKRTLTGTGTGMLLLNATISNLTETEGYADSKIRYWNGDEHQLLPTIPIHLLRIEVSVE